MGSLVAENGEGEEEWVGRPNGRDEMKKKERGKGKRACDLMKKKKKKYLVKANPLI